MLDVSCGTSPVMSDSIDDLEFDSDESISLDGDCHVVLAMYAFALKVDGSAFWILSCLPANLRLNTESSRLGESRESFFASADNSRGLGDSSMLNLTLRVSGLTNGG